MLYPNTQTEKYFANDVAGYEDDVRIYDRELSTLEIAEIYNKTKYKYQ